VNVVPPSVETHSYIPLSLSSLRSPSTTSNTYTSVPFTSTLGGSKYRAWLGSGTVSDTGLHAVAPAGSLQNVSVVSVRGFGFSHAVDAVPVESTATAGVGYHTGHRATAGGGNLTE
jgi:hypothetical protein